MSRCSGAHDGGRRLACPPVADARSFLDRHWAGTSFLLFLAVAFAFTGGAWADPAHTWAAAVVPDTEKFINFLAWYPHAISHGINPLLDSYANLPRGTNMMWDTTMPLPAVVAWPITAAFGPIMTYNVLLTAGLALDGWCTLLWLKRHVTNPVAAIGGALVMEVGPYTGTRATEHLNLVLIFAVPLLMIALEELFFYQRPSSWRIGIFTGAAAAVQLLCTEEALAIFLVMAVLVLVIAAVATRPRPTRAQVVYCATGLGVAFCVFLLITAYPLYYQFFGTAVVHGQVQYPQLWANNLWDLVVPNSHAWFQLPVFHNVGAESHASIAGIEANAYIGIPMLLVLLYMFIKWRRDRWVVGPIVVAACAFVLALGPHLIIGRSTHSNVVLPDAIVTHLPILENILPGRYGLPLDLALALVLATFLDRHVLIRPVSAKSAAAGAAAILTGVTLVAAPVPTVHPEIPTYFASGGDVRHLPPGEAVLLIPFSRGASMLWQAIASFHFRIDEGLAIAAQANGRAGFFTGGPIPKTYGSIEQGGVPSETQQLRSELLAQLQSVGTRAVMVGPMGAEATAIAFTSWLLGERPREDEGIYIWQMPAPALAQASGGNFWSQRSTGAKRSPFSATRPSIEATVNESGRRPGSSSSSHSIGADTGAPGAGRGLYGATSVLLPAFWV